MPKANQTCTLAITLLANSVVITYQSICVSPKKVASETFGIDVGFCLFIHALDINNPVKL